MKYFSWLHLTDLHRGMKDQHWLWPGVREIFFEDLKKLHEKCGPWDLVLFTGDLTQRGSDKEFQKVNELLEQLWEQFSKLDSSPRLLAVPGNHDLARPSKKNPSVRLLQQWLDLTDIQEEFWEEADSPYRQIITKAFENYIVWWEKQPLRVKDANTGILPGDFSATIEKDGARLGIVGLNTSFLQLTDDDYKGKLALHARQFQKACGDDGPTWAKHHHACLLLTHHPPTWLDSNSRQHLNGEITAHGRFAAHLCGHLHETAYRDIAEGGTEARCIWQGHSLFGLEYFGKEDESQRLHGYTAGRIELTENMGTLLFWPREARLQGGQRSIVPDYSLALTDEQHTNPRKFGLLQSYEEKPLSQESPPDGLNGDLDRQAVKVVGQEKAITVMSEDKHVFLSYTRKDTAKVQQIRQSLEYAGHVVWQDMSDVKGGEEWINSIADGIKRSYAVVSVVSKASVDNRWVRLEYLEAQRRNKLVIPVRIDDCEIPIHMLDINVIDGSSNLNNGINKIIAALPAVKSIIETAEPFNTRQFELDYLDLVLWEYSYWKEVYTPMAGVAQIQSNSQKTRVRRATAKIKPIFNATFREEIRKAFTSPSEISEEPLDDITTIVDKARHVIILGEPGSGKTTTMWNLLAKYAEIAKQVKNAPLPILLHMGRLLPHTSVHEQLQEQISHLSLDGLLSHKRIIVLLDALNELPIENQSSKIAELRELARLAQQENMIMVVTSRELDYGEDVDLGIENHVTIAPLDPNRIRLFCNNRLPDNGETLFWQLLGDDARLVRTFWEAWESQELGSFQAMWEKETLPEGFYSFRPEVKAMRRLRAAIRGESNSRSMLVLASNPYMLCMIADVFAETAQLPQNRGKLLELFTNYLLREREGLDEDETLSLKSQVAVMAYNIQLEKKGININRELVLNYLSEDMIYKAISANLIEGSNTLRFSHQLLQEYFAALGLDRAIKNGITASKFWTDENWWEPSGWEDTVLLLTGLYHDNTTPIIHWSQRTNPEIAARCIIESGAHTPADVQEKLRTIWLSRLTDIEQISHPKARASVGRALGKLNLDDRPGVGLTIESVPDIVWCEVPEGIFLMGSDQHKDPDVTSREPELHKLFLPTFYVARYLVTYVQYEAFVSDGGYTNRDYWTKAGWERKGEWRYPSLYWNEPWWHIANHPVIGVTWYEAFAFTRWLSQKLGYEVRLPTEAEYEKAARGVNGLIYPYGDKLDLNKSNAFENLGRTSAVGIFPSGNSPYDVSDMSGNVFEWCLSAWSNPYKHHTVNQVDIESPERRVVRGGAWNRTFDNCVRAAFRGRSDPFACFYLNGFRVYADRIVKFSH